MNKYEKYIDLVLKWNKTHSVTNYNKNELKEIKSKLEKISQELNTLKG